MAARGGGGAGRGGRAGGVARGPRRAEGAEPRRRVRPLPRRGREEPRGHSHFDGAVRRAPPPPCCPSSSPKRCLRRVGGRARGARGQGGQRSAREQSLIRSRGSEYERVDEALGAGSHICTRQAPARACVRPGDAACFVVFFSSPG